MYLLERGRSWLRTRVDVFLSSWIYLCKLDGYTAKATQTPKPDLTRHDGTLLQETWASSTPVISRGHCPLAGSFPEWQTPTTKGYMTKLFLDLKAIIQLEMASIRAENTVLELECIVNQYKQMTCLWNQHRDPGENYTMNYRFGNEDLTAPCSEYLLNGNTTIGCWFKKAVDTFQSFTAELNGNILHQPIRKTYKLLQNQVKLDPPYDLHVENTSNFELFLKWNQSEGEYRSHCICYQVQHRSSTSGKWTVKNVSARVFSLPSFDPKKTYTFQVRSKLNDQCSSALIWSTWSLGVTWGRNATLNADGPQGSIWKNLIIYIASSVTLVILMILLVRVERIWVIFVPTIPNPGKNFEDLFKIYEGDFKEWLGVSKEAVESLEHDYNEPLCSVSEEYDTSGLESKHPTPA
ncbi:cytokine receptor common subunit gamma [Pelodytes ibericus]